MGTSSVLDRKGMSPLIATVLLMAFAVALGGMIMNWSIDISTNSACDDIKATVESLCTQDGAIILRMHTAQDSVALQGIKLLVVAENVENTLSVKNSAVKPGGSLPIRIPYAGASDARVELIGVVGSEANEYVCTTKPIGYVDPIRPCTQ